MSSGAYMQELLYYLLLYTFVAVTSIYTFMGLVFFILNRNIRLIFLPFLYLIFGAITGIVDGAILCTRWNFDEL